MPSFFDAAWRLLRDTALAWSADRASSMGAALAYYALFSIAPLLLLVISVAGLVFGEQAARGEIMEQLADLIGVDSARAVEALLQNANQPAAGALGTVVGIVLLVVGATTVLAELRASMDAIWREPGERIAAPWWQTLRVRLLSAGLVLGIGFLLVVSLVASAALAAIAKWWAPWFGEGAMALADTLNFGLSLGFVAAVFAMIYKWMPRVRLAWRDVLVGATITALLFTLGKSLIGVYIGRSGVASSFGAAASVVVLLVWVYYSAQIFLLGAEFTWLYAHRHGSLRNTSESRRMHAPEPTPVVPPPGHEPDDDAPTPERTPPAVEDPPEPRSLPPVQDPGRHPPARA